MDVLSSDKIVMNNSEKLDKSKLDLLKDKGLTFDELIREFSIVFESNSVDIDYVNYLMSLYQSNPQDWRKFAKFDRHRYTRNLVDEGNGKFNLMVLCWGEGHGSAIHDHADAHCFMKILQGELCETKYTWPTNDTDSLNEDEDVMKEVDKNTLNINDVCYINDTIGLHRVENPSTINTAVSLHLYSPPFSSCSVFNRQTGQKTPSTVTFWSKYGERRNREIQENRSPEDN